MLLRSARLFAGALIALLGARPGAANADSFGARTNIPPGNWSDPATWTDGTINGVPGPNDAATVGTTFPPGSASTASVYLTQNSAAYSVTLGDGSGTSGTLDLHGFNLSIGGTGLALGINGGLAAIQRTGGGTLTLTTAGINVLANDFSFAAGDTTPILTLSAYGSTPATVTTAAAGNVSQLARVNPGCTLTLGADLAAGEVDLRGNLNANGHGIGAFGSTVEFGYFGGPFTITNRGPITAGDLRVSSQYSPGQTSFDLTTSDAVTTFSLYGVDTTFPTGAAVNNLNLYSNANSTLRFSTATITASGNVTNTVLVDPGNTLNLQADLNLQSSLDLRGTLNANGHALTATNSFHFGSIYLGYNNGPFVLNNRGAVTTDNLYVSSKYSPSQTAFNLTASDQVTNFNLYGVGTTFPAGAQVQNLSLYSNGNSTPTYSTATTSSTGNVATNVYVDPGCTLNLGANLPLTGDLDLRGTLNANGHAISGLDLFVGYNAGPATLTNPGVITTPFYKQGNGTQVRLPVPGDSFGHLTLSNSTVLTVGDAPGQTTGLTLSGPNPTDVSIDPTSDLALEVNGLAGGWVLRWANLSGADHIADLQGLISQGRIEFAPANGGGYSLTADPNYTYVDVSPVPEPGTLLLSAAAAVGLAFRRRRFKR
jgi:hypothetical protein